VSCKLGITAIIGYGRLELVEFIPPDEILDVPLSRLESGGQSGGDDE